MAIAAGQCIGPYEIEAPLGAGGMGEVYVAMDRRLRRRVAIKRLTGPSSQAAHLRRWTLNEARAAAKLNHPNIAAIYDVLDSGEADLIVMEYVEGQTLAARLRDGRVPPDEAVRIGAAVAEGLAAAHRAGVVHRDLKPGNIVLTPDGGVKILDFGLARIVDPPTGAGAADTTVTTTGVRQLAGTPAYMPPERVLGRPVDHRGDIYSLGVVLFELLTGRLPFAAPDFIALLTQIATQPAPAAHEIDPNVPVELGTIVKRAMSADPAVRYQTANALRSDLLAYAARTVVDPPKPVRPRARWLSPALAAAILLAVALGTFVTWRSSRPHSRAVSTQAATTIAVMPLVNHTGERRNDHLGVGISDVLAAGLFTVPGLNVVSCSAASDCSNAEREPRKAAERLGATMLLDGGVQRQGDDVSVTVRLTDLATGRLVWGNEYPSRISDLLDVQRQMSADVARTLGQSTVGSRAGLQTDERTRGTTGSSNVAAFELYSQARLMLERRDIQGHAKRAIELLRSAISHDQEFTLAHAALGDAYWLMYEETRDRAWTDRATEAILEALRLDSSQPQVRLSLATMYLGTGELEKAAAEAKRAAELQPQSDEAHRLLAAVLTESGRADEAVAEARTAIRLRPRFWRNHNQLGYIFLRAGRFQEAAAAHTTSIELQPDNAQSHHMLGTAYLAMGNPAAAVGPLTRANEIQPDARSLSNLGTVHYWAGRYEQAAAAYRQAIELRPREPVHYRNLGDALQRLGKTREAADAYSRAVRATEDILVVSPRDAHTRAMLAVYLAKLGRHGRAAAEIQQALALNAGSQEVWYRKAVVHALAGETATALDALTEAVRRGASRSGAAHDEDFASLKGDPRFNEVVAEVQR